MGSDFGCDPVGPVVADDADDIAFCDAELDHAEREIMHPRLVVVPGEQAPQAEILFAQRNLVAMLARIEPQQFWIGIGLRDAARIIHHAALSSRAGTRCSSGSTSTSSSSPR
jgi:hypothetical protein